MLEKIPHIILPWLFDVWEFRSKNILKIWRLGQCFDIRFVNLII